MRVPTQFEEAYIQRLEAENERLRAALKQRDEDHATITRDLRSEIERLRGK
jgi:predicted transcriptional regulator